MVRYLSISDDAVDYTNNVLTQGQVQTDFGENFDASIEHAWHSMMSISKSHYTNRYQDEEGASQAERAKQLGIELPSINDVNRDASTEYQDGHYNTYNERIAKLKEANPDQEWLTYEELNDKTQRRVIDEAKKARANYHDVSNRADGWGTAGSFVGIAAGAMSDPVNIGVTIATLPLALESWGAVIGANALIGGAAETAVQFAPGGVRDFAREQGLTEQEIDDETGMAVGGATVGGGVFAGLIHGGVKGIGALARKVIGTDRNAARTAADELLNTHAADLTTDQRDLLTIIRDGLGIEDDASPGVSGRMTAEDAARMADNLKKYVQVSEALANDNVGLFHSLAPDEAVDAISARIGDVDKIINEINAGRIGRDNLDPLFRAILSDDQLERFHGLTEEYSSYRPKNRLDTLARIENEIAIASRSKELVEEAPGRAFARQSELTKAQKEHGDLTQIVDELTQTKTKLERELANLKIAYGLKGAPKPDVLVKVGVPEETALRIRDITERLGENISKKERAKIEAELRTLMDDPSVVASRDNLKTLIDDTQTQIDATTRDLDGFSRDLPRTAGELDRVQKLAEKAQRRADKLTDPDYAQQVEADAGNAIDAYRADAQANKEVWSNSEILAALDVLDEVKASDHNKLAFAELVKMNGTASASTLRELAQFSELRSRLKDGEPLTMADFQRFIPEEQRADFQSHVDGTDDLTKAVDQWWADATAKLSADGQARIENAARHIDDILRNIPNPERFGERINVPEGVAPEVHYEAVKAFANDTLAQERLQRVIDDAINTERVYPDTAEGRVLAQIEAELKGMADEVAEHEHLADILEACKA